MLSSKSFLSLLLTQEMSRAKKMPPDDMIIIMGWIFHTQTSVVGTKRNIKESLGQKIDSNFFRSWNMLHYSTLGMQIKVSSLSAWLRFRANLKSFSAIKVLSARTAWRHVPACPKCHPHECSGQRTQKEANKTTGEKREEQTAQNRGMREREWNRFGRTRKKKVSQCVRVLFLVDAAFLRLHSDVFLLALKGKLSVLEKDPLKRRNPCIFTRDA